MASIGVLSSLALCGRGLKLQLAAVPTSLCLHDLKARGSSAARSAPLLYSSPVRASSLCLCALLLFASALPALAQGKVRIPGFRDRIGAGTTVSKFLKPFQNVQVTPLARGAIFAFDTREAVNTVVKIGRSAPVQIAQGRAEQLRWAFSAGEEVPAFKAVRAQNAGITTHRLRLQPVLTPNTTYFYILEAIAPGGQLIQETGSFSTISRRVKVVFQRIRVIEGGDGAGTGDLMFQFFLNYDKTTNRNFEWLGGRQTPLKIANGQSINAGKSFTLKDVDELHLVVNGYDEDFLTVGPPPSSGDGNSVQVPYPLDVAGHKSAGAWNVAKGDFDLSSLAPSNKSVTIPFSLSSLPLPGTGDGQDVAFEISGTYTILPSLLQRGISKAGGIKSPDVTSEVPVPRPPGPGPRGATSTTNKRTIRIVPNH